jgi:hypothetical protein
MDSVLSQIVIVLVPALVVLFVAFYLVKYQLEALHRKFGYFNSGGAPGAARPNHVNFQAYERLVLFLERINPGNMALRMNKPGASARMLEADMVKSIREEYEHNLSQQIYFSDEIWKLIKQAKNETIKLVSLASQKCTDKSSATDLSKILLEISSKVDEFPHDVAIRYLKQELREKV